MPGIGRDGGARRRREGGTCARHMFLPQNAQRSPPDPLKICQKILKNPLTHTGVLLYDNGASERALSAMMREIAAKAGNFRGVCPTIGRLKDPLLRRISPCMVETGLLSCRFLS